MNDHTLSPVMWAILLPGLAVLGVVGTIRLWRSVKAPDRARLDPMDGARGPAFVITGSLLYFGGVGVFDGDRSTDAYVSGVMLLVGVVLVALLARHLAKPVRREHESSSEGGGTATSWYVPTGDQRPRDSDA